jgi:Ca2+-binding EF-hand superfamily protein
VHPDVHAGRVAPEELEQSLADCFNADTNPSGLISREDFEAWCAGVSAADDSDEHFVLVMNNCWHLSPPKRTTNSFGTMASTYGLDAQVKLPLETSAAAKMQTINTMKSKDQLSFVIKRLFDHLLHRRLGIRGLGQAYRSLDGTGRGFLRADDFAQVTKMYDLPLSDQEIELLVQIFDADGDGSVNFDEFLLHIRGELLPRRKKIIERAFNKFDLNDDGIVDAFDLRTRFQVVQNPVVVKGKRTAEEIVSDFREAFADGSVTYEEFEEYWATISALVANDKHFEIMMQNAFA